MIYENEENLLNLKTRSSPFNEISLILILTLTVIIIGLIGNVLNVFVLGRKSMRQMTIFRFLFYLSMIDILVLLTCTTHVILAFGFDYEIKLHSTTVCRLHSFLTTTLAQMSSMVLMVISFERAVIICSDSSNKIVFRLSQCDMRRSRNFVIQLHFVKNRFVKKYHIEITIGFVATFLILLNMHSLFFLDINVITNKLNLDDFNRVKNALSMKINDKDGKNIRFDETIEKIFGINYMDVKQIENSVKSCYPLKGTLYYAFLNRIWIWLDILIYSLIPFTIMTASSIAIYLSIRKQSRTLMTNMNNGILQKRLRRSRQIFLILTLTNMFFILSSLPHCILYLKVNIYEPDESIEKMDTKFSLFLDLLAYSNSWTNFIFYGLFSKKYRQELANIINLNGDKKLLINVGTSNNKKISAKSSATLRESISKKSNFLNAKKSRKILVLKSNSNESSIRRQFYCDNLKPKYLYRRNSILIL